MTEARTTSTTTPATSSSAAASNDPLEIANKVAPSQASPREILELKPNKAADATSGPDPQGKPLSYTSWTRPDGSTFIAPADNDETYERKGFKKGSTEEIPDLVANLEEHAKREPGKRES